MTMMAVYDHEEQEQLDEIKAWWKQHGNTVINIVLVFALAVSAVAGWKWWQSKQSAEAATLYGRLQTAAEKHDVKAVRDSAVELADKYSSTSYAGMGALLAARVQLDSGDAKNAKAQLAWVADKVNDPALRDLARLRLAALLLDDKAYDDALKQLAADSEPSFSVRFAELKGDVYAAQGKKEDARTAYQAALAKLDGGKSADGSPDSPNAQREAMHRELMQLKLDSLGGKV
ncbi:MAG TPA: tetratricopeptide repeat protein [Rhodocyclaceae bacterium]|jgi:predicted negative regulator of RcsB-dependent stress response|nr:tetratricopeptide repeat protein [Rhodocyclaceae bacterium]